MCLLLQLQFFCDTQYISHHFGMKALNRLALAEFQELWSGTQAINRPCLFKVFEIPHWLFFKKVP